MADFQLELGPIVGAGAPVGPVFPAIGPVAGGGGAASRGSGSRVRSGSGSMGAERSWRGYSRGPSRRGVGAETSRSGTAAGRGMSNVSGDLQAPARGGSVIPRSSVTHRRRGRGRGGPTETIVISSAMFNLIL